MEEGILENWLVFIIPIIFLLFFMAIWGASLFFTSVLSGWRKLAAVYGGRPLPPRACWPWQSLLLRANARYSRSVTFCADMEGVYIQPMLIFRLGHAPLFIPWFEIEGEVKHVGWMDIVEMRFQRMPEIPCRIRIDLADKLVNASMGNWHYKPKQIV